MVSDRSVSDKGILNNFVADFVRMLDEQKVKYIIVSGFVAISHGRSRGTEDVDIIIEQLSQKRFGELNLALIRAGFECLQGNESSLLFEDYLKENLSIRYVRKDSFVPEMELKFAKDELDEEQLKNRVKLPLTNLPFWFSSIETNIAFKEELLKSEKDLEDAMHLRVVYSEKISEKEVDRMKSLINKYRLGK